MVGAEGPKLSEESGAHEADTRPALFGQVEVL